MNNLKQINSVTLKFLSNDVSHRGNYKKSSNNVVAFDADDRKIGVVFETASPFGTPLARAKPVNWLNETIDKKRIYPLAVKILALLKEHERLSITEIETLTNANRNTLKVRLCELVSDNYIEQNGKARSTWYRLKA